MERQEVGLKGITLSTVNLGFYDQPPSQGSRPLNPKVVAKLSEFLLGSTTRWSLKPM